MKYAVVSLMLVLATGCTQKKTYNEGCVDGIREVLSFIGMTINEDGAKKRCAELEKGEQAE